MTEDAYAVGVVGCGWMGQSHGNTYRDHEDTDVVAAADMNESVREEYASEYDLERTFEDHEAMLAGADLDIVSICTWHSTHAEIAIDACEAGVEGILCEKPMATSHGESQDMLDAADRNDVKLTVSHQRRFDPINEKARALVQDGAIGEPQSVTARQMSGLLNWGTHLIDLARYLLDDPGYEWVMGQVERNTERYERALPIEDRCLCHLSFEDGTRMTYESDMPDPDYADSTLQVSGTDGVLEVDLGESVRVVNGEGEHEYAPTMEAGTRTAFLDEFVEWLDGDRSDHRCSGQKAGDVMEIMMAVYESARVRGVVESPLETRANPLEIMIEEGDLPVEHPGKYDIRLPYASVRGD